MFEMMLKTLIAALDLKIDPLEVEAAFERAKTLIPELAVKMHELEARMIRIETIILAIAAKHDIKTEESPTHAQIVAPANGS